MKSRSATFGRGPASRRGRRVQAPLHPRERLDRHLRAGPAADDAREPRHRRGDGRMVGPVAQQDEEKPEIGGRGDVVQPLREELVHAGRDCVLAGAAARPRVLLQAEQRVDRVAERARAVVVHVAPVLVDRRREGIERELARVDLLEEGGRPVEQRAGADTAHDSRLPRRGLRFDALSSRRHARAPHRPARWPRGAVSAGARRGSRARRSRRPSA